METLYENNKMIALFMSNEPDVLKHDLKKAGTIESMHYHDQWDWLMPVVDRIVVLGHKVVFNQEEQVELSCEIICYDDGMQVNEIFVDDCSMIDSVYQAVSEFIVWYNLSNF